MTFSRSRRPLSVTLLALLVFSVAILNFLRLVITAQKWAFLAGLLPMSPLYLVLSGLLWCLAGILLAWGLWRGKPWGPKLTLISIVAYTLHYWLDRLFMPGYPQRNTGGYFLIGVNLLIVFLSLWALSRPRARYFFGEKHEEKK